VYPGKGGYPLTQIKDNDQYSDKNNPYSNENDEESNPYNENRINHGNEKNNQIYDRFRLSQSTPGSMQNFMKSKNFQVIFVFIITITHIRIYI
jgi:hypothetical protein